MANSKNMVACMPEDESERLAALEAYAVLDTPPEVSFDRLTKMAVHNLGVPIALVSLIDEQRQWFKSHHGIDVRETHRDLAFCAHVILADEVMVVPDAQRDPRFAENPLVTGAPHIRFYAGAPLITRDGHRLGTFCVIDRVPHPEFDGAMQQRLADYAAIAMDELELRRLSRAVPEPADAAQAAPLDLDRLQVIAETLPEKRELLGLFFSLIPKTVAALEAALAAGDEESWQRALHSAKGMASNLGMYPLAAMCEGAQRTARAAWQDILAQLQSEIIRVRLASQPLLAEGH